MRLKIKKVVNRYGIEMFKLRKTSEKSSNKKFTTVYVDTCTFSSDSCFNIGNKIKNINIIYFILHLIVTNIY